jgi:hypothetical protein
MNNRVPQQAAAGKLTNLRSPYARRVASMTTALIALLTIIAFSGMSASPALAAGTPGWQILTTTQPTAFEGEEPERHNSYTLVVSNLGKAPTNGGTITLTDTLPPGVTMGYLSHVFDDVETEHPAEPGEWYCPLDGTGSFNGWEIGGSTLTCTFSGTLGTMGTLPPLRLPLLVFNASIRANSEVSNSVTVSGGGAAVAQATQTTEVNRSTPLPFEVAAPELTSFLSGLDGEQDTQAGDHPSGLTSSFGVSTVFHRGEIREIKATQPWKDIVVDLPPGVVGDPQVAAQCPWNELYVGRPTETERFSACPAASQVGTLLLASRFHGGNEENVPAYNIPIYNMVPTANEPAEYAFIFEDYQFGIYPTVVGQGAGAHIRVSVPGIAGSWLVGVFAQSAKFFGDPDAEDGDPSAPNAFFTNSSDCQGGPLVTELHVDSYTEPGSWLADGPGVEGPLNFTDSTPDFSDSAWKSASYSSPPVSGCEKLHFDPSLGLQPETTQADEPSGLAVDLSIPQNPDPHGLATPPFKDVTVTLPAGVSLSPSAADGLQACTAEQFDLESNTDSSCPNASVLGTAKVTTPLLAEPLPGYVFLAEPGCDPCGNQDASDGNMFKLYLQIEGSGVVQKVPGTIYVNTKTGQLTTTFLENPQFPVSDVQLQFKGGLRAGLATPQSCGTFTATSDMTPWSTPYTPDATPESSFDVSWNGAGEACPSSPPLTPSFSAGTSNPNAGQFSPFTLTFAREDRQQDLSGIQVKMPPGLLGSISGVPLCEEGPANAGTCSQSSRIGTMTVAAGPGNHPFYTQGSIYLTESYGGAPFGLSIVVPTVAGPFNLGNVVVRSRINIDPTTAALTVTSNPLPQILDGIPLRLRTANVTIERPNFMFNPTSCAQQHIEATISGAQGATANVSAPFAVSGCAGLHFGPKFTVSTSGKTSKADGASLDAKVVFPSGAQSNIAKVKVDLPKQLPSRLTTLQKACTAAQFESNPAGCPSASVIGIARTSTPILPVPLEGPVYFVSHGGEAFPSLVVVLQGDGVRVDLTAATFISKAGITSSTFNTIPDVPVNSFELYLPEGKYSALAANGNLCTSKLAMPTAFVAQDGTEIHESTPVSVTACPKAKKAVKKKKKAKAKKSSKARKASYGQGRKS